MNSSRVCPRVGDPKSRQVYYHVPPFKKQQKPISRMVGYVYIYYIISHHIPTISPLLFYHHNYIHQDKAIQGFTTFHVSSFAEPDMTWGFLPGPSLPSTDQTGGFKYLIFAHIWDDDPQLTIFEGLKLETTSWINVSGLRRRCVFLTDTIAKRLDVKEVKT